MNVNAFAKWITLILSLVVLMGCAKTETEPDLQFPTAEVERAVLDSSWIPDAIPAAGNTQWTKIACCVACVASDGPDPTDGLTCTWCWYSIPSAGSSPPPPFLPYQDMKARLYEVLPADASDYGFRVQHVEDTTFSVTNIGKQVDTGIVSALVFGIPLHPGENLADARVIEPQSLVLADMQPGETREVILEEAPSPDVGFAVGVMSTTAIDKEGNGLDMVLTKSPMPLPE